ncbi:MAG TPA: succinylglutamate desuccinylase/aspartoacylase family protein [Gaiellaceae bacterium]|nr:succinylglutamate desuccinylase/aspartoacylase family protein [Gaiellaceae bacterium]
MAGSPVRCTIDLDAPGRRVGSLDLPRSSNTSGWSALRIPIVSVVGGEGPSALVIGGCHGDEPEGQVAAINLARELRPDDVPGRVHIVPCLSLEASRAYTRLWPSGANMNRSFPGDPDGAPDEQLAHFLSTELFPRVDIVVDIHSGGRSGMCLPWSEMHWVDDAEQRRRMVDGMLAWNTDWCVIYIDIAGGGLLVGEAERQGKTVVSTELGGGGHVTAAIHQLAASGVRNVLRQFGALIGDVEIRQSLGRPEPTILRATDLEDYLLAPASGLFETLVELGEHVDSGQTVGVIHFLDDPERSPEPVVATSSGVVCVIRAIATTDQGDNVVVIGHEVDRAELE